MSYLFTDDDVDVHPKKNLSEVFSASESDKGDDDQPSPSNKRRAKEKAISVSEVEGKGTRPCISSLCTYQVMVRAKFCGECGTPQVS